MEQNRNKRWMILAVVELLLVAAGFLAVLYADGRLGERTYAGEAIPFSPENQKPAQTVELSRGSYLVTVNYTSDEEAYSQTRMTKAYGDFSGDRIILLKEAEQKSFELMLFGRVSDFYLFCEEPSLVVESVVIKETGQWSRVCLFLAVVALLLLDLFLWQHANGLWRTLSFERKNMILACTVIGLLASMPLFTDYLLSGCDDMWFHLMRIEGLAEGLRQGDFPVKFQPLWLNDYGYPVSVMYGDLFLYLPALLRIIGFPLQTVLKIYMFGVNMLTAFFACRCGHRISGSYKTGIVTSLLYTLSVYRLTNLYYRNALGEYTAMMLFPLVFLGLWMLFQSADRRERNKSLLLLATAFTGILESHLLSFEMAVMFAVLYCLLHLRVFLRQLAPLVLTALVTLALNLYFLVPCLDFMRTQNLQILSDHRFHMQEWGLFFPQLFQMFSFSTKGHGYFSAGLGIGQERLYGVGLPFAIVAGIYLWELLVFGGELQTGEGAKADLSESLKLFGLMLLGIAMTCVFFPWDAIQGIPVLGKLFAPYQFAWRFSQAATVFGVMVAAYALKNLRVIKEPLLRCGIVTALCVCAVITACYHMEIKVAGSEPLRVTSAAGLDTRAAIGNGEYLLLNTYAPTINEQKPVPDDGILIKDYEKKSGVITVSFENTTEREGCIKVPVFLYNGCRVTDTATQYDYNVTADYSNVLMVIIPAGYAGEMEIYFDEPAGWATAEGISLATLFGVVITGILLRKRRAFS